MSGETTNNTGIAANTGQSQASTSVPPSVEMVRSTSESNDPVLQAVLWQSQRETCAVQTALHTSLDPRQNTVPTTTLKPTVLDPPVVVPSSENATEPYNQTLVRYQVAGDGDCGPVTLAVSILILLKTKKIDLDYLFDHENPAPHTLLKVIFENAHLTKTQLQKVLTNHLVPNPNKKTQQIIKKLAAAIRLALPRTILQSYLEPYLRKKDQTDQYLIDTEFPDHVQDASQVVEPGEWIDVATATFFMLACGIRLRYVLPPNSLIAENPDVRVLTAENIDDQYRTEDYAEIILNLPIAYAHYSGNHFEPMCSREDHDLLITYSQRFMVLLRAILHALVVVLQTVWAMMTCAYAAQQIDPVSIEQSTTPIGIPLEPLIQQPDAVADAAATHAAYHQAISAVS